MADHDMPPPITETTQANPSKLIVHHLDDSRSMRILWLLEELEVPYEIKMYKRTAEKRSPEDLKKQHPLGASPLITDGELTLAESGAIVEYIIKKYGNGCLQPTEASYVDNLYWTHYSEGTLMPLIVNKFVFSIIPANSPMLLRPLTRAICNGINTAMVAPRMKQHADYVESYLAKTEGKGVGWCGGEELTSADFMMLFPLEFVGAATIGWGMPTSASVAGKEGGGFGPKSQAYLKRMHERPAYKRALEKGGPYSFA